MNLHDVIKINPEQTNAAIVLEQGLSNNALVAHYTPTQASIQVFDHFCKAVLPSATQEQHAINLYGSYGSGKSHLAVVLAHLLRDGTYTPGFELFLNRLHQVNQAQLAENLKNTFLAKNDADAKPYLLVRVLKVPPDSAFKSAKHQIYHGNVNESGAGLGQHLVIFAQATVAVKPGKSPFNHPAARQ